MGEAIWAFILLVVAGTTFGFQIHVSRTGDSDPAWPMIATDTRAAKIAVLSLSGTMVVIAVIFCVWALLD